MRYEDTTQAGGIAQGHGPNAENDLDALTAGSRTPAMGNVITGEGTKSGAAGADTGDHAHIISISGKGGEDSSFVGGKLTAEGDYGKLTIDADGNYRYVPKANVPENSLDRFVYTLADGTGGHDAAVLTIEFGKTQTAVKANAQQVVPGPDGVVVLPAGVELSDVHIVGRNLVIDLPDGTQMVIVDGAVFVPQLSLDGVEVPATNLAALLIGSEPKPAAGGEPPSSGGNFEVPVPPLDPGVPLGDLIPPTEYNYKPPEVREPLQTIDHQPTVTVTPDNGVAVQNAVDSVDESGLPAREGEPAGSNAPANSETTTGTINIDSQDNPTTVTIDGVAITNVGQVIHGQYGDLTITSISGTAIGYSYTLLDNTNGNNTSDLFNVVVTDVDGDTAHASLTVNIIDDVPTARPDSDSVAAGTYGPETGNVMTGAGTAAGAGGTGADTVGADNATLTSVSGSGGSDSSFDEAGHLVVHGQYGTLTIDAQGNYSYVRDPGTPGGVNDVFNYTLTDGDGDPSTSTLTINIGDSTTTVHVPTGEDAATLVYEAGLPTRNGGEPAGSGESADGNGSNNSDSSETTAGVISFTAPDSPATVTINGTTVTGTVGQVIHGTYGDLTITSYNGTTGQIGYSYTLLDNTSGDTTKDSFAVVVKDVDGDTSSATLNINIVDDVPTAHNDVDTIAGGGSEATGNVITGDSTDGGLNGPGHDVVGADNATVIAVSSDNVSGNADTTPSGANGELVVNGEYGVLTIFADGHYDYVRNDGTPGNVSDVFTYTLKDGDGDPTTATLTINIEDATPTLGTPAVVQLDDDAVLGAGGNPGGPNDDPDNVNASGTLAGSGGDGALTYGFSGTNTLPSGFTVSAQPNGDLWVMQGATHVMTVTLDTATGAYSATQVHAIDHPSLDGLPGDNTENNLTFDIGVKVTDVDGDPATATLTINVDDDTPTVTPKIDAEAALSVDESGPAAAAAIDTPGIVKGDDPNVAGSGAISHDSSGVALVDLNASFGADGPAASNPIHYELNVTNATSGLTLTDGSAINLVELANGVVVGVVQGGAFADQAAFAITIDPTTGVVTIEQYLSLDHPVNPNPNDSLTLAAGSLAIVGTATDHDGDTVSTGNVDVSGQFTFFDDGPSVNPTLNAEATVSVDESLPSTTPTITLLDHVYGDDPDLSGPLALGHATSGSAIVSPDAAFGADGPAAGGGVGYALTIINTSSGLTLTDGTAINLVMDHGVIVGVVASGAFAGQAALAIAIDPTTGVVTVEQYLSLHNPDAPNNYDEIVQLANNTVGVTVTATDGDGDSITSSAVDVSHQFSFHDDGPAAVNDTATQSAENAPVTVNVFANDVGGADGALASSVALVSGSLHVTAGQTAGALVNNGDGTFTYTPSAGQTGDVTFQYTITDGDGDKSQATVTIHLTADSVPQIGTPANLTVDEDGFPNANVDTNPLQSNPQEVDSNESLTNSGSVVVSYGSDVPTGTLTNSITLVDTAALDGQLQRLNGSPVTFALNGSGQLVGSADGHTVIIISVTGAVAGPGADQVTYTYQAQLLEPLEHPAGGGENTDILSGVTFQVTDSDGSHANGTFNVTVYDDVPSLAFTTTAEGTVLLTTHDALTDGVPTDQDVASTTANFSGVFSLIATPGADGGTPTAIAYDLNVTDSASGLTSHGAAITLVELANGTIVGYTGGVVPTLESAASVVFSVKVDASGDVTLTQYQQIDHPAEASPVPGTDAPFDDQLVALADGHITLTGSASLTDGDGDTANASRTIDLGGNLQFADDGPGLTNVSGGASVTLDETNGAIAGLPGGMNPISATSLSAVITATQAFGADGPAASGSVTYGLSLNGGALTLASGLQTAVGDLPITLNLVDSTHITGTYAGGTAFSITMNANGTITVTQNVPLEHLVDGSTTAAYDDSLDLVTDGSLVNLVNAIITIKDYDGDTATASTGIGDQIIFKDDGPSINVTAGADAGVTLTTQDHDTIGLLTDAASSTANFGGVFNFTASGGADGAVATPVLNYALGVSSSGVDSGLDSHGANIYLYTISGVVVGSTSATQAGVTAGNTIFDVSVNGTGVVTLSQYQQIDHPAAADPTPGGAPYADQSVSMLDSLITLTGSASITDNDGDTASSSQTVNIGANLIFQDDGPSASVNGAATLDTLVLDESRPVGTDTTGASAPSGLATVTANFADNFTTVTSASYGADGAGSTAYSLVLTGADVASGLYALQPGDTSTSDGDGYGQGDQIVLNQVGNTITGSVGSTDYFTITIDPSTGVVTFTQLANIWQPTAGNNDDTSTLDAALNALKIVQTVTDFDGDKATASIDLSKGVFQIQDDGPHAFAPAAVSAGNGDTAPVTASLGLDIGTDGLGQLLFNGSYDGQTAMDSGGHLLSLGGQQLYYHVSGNTLTATTSATTGGTVGFTVTLNTNGTYTLDVNGTISNGTETSFTDLTSAAAGNVNYRGVGADATGNNAGNIDLLLSASNNGATVTVNTNSTAVGSGNQSMNAGESVRIDFVTNMTTGGGATGFNYTDHSETHSYTQAIPQVQGAQSNTVAIHVWALESTLTAAGLPDSSPAGPGDGFDDASVTAITSVTITDYATSGSTTLDISALAANAWTLVNYGVYVMKLTDGSVEFSGLQEGDKYSIGTGANSFNAVVIEGMATGTGPVGHVSTTDGFDLGILSIGTVSAGTDIVQNFNVTAIDGDGDPISASISTTITPPSPPAPLAPATTMAASSEAVTSSTLMASDTNHTANQGAAKHNALESRMIEAANTNSFAAAAAVAGVAGFATSAAASQGLHQTFDASGSAVAHQAESFAALATDDSEAARPIAFLESGHMVKAEVAESSATSFDSGSNHGEGVAGAGGHSQSVSQLAAPTEAAHAAPEVSTFVAPMVAMPTAAMVAAANLDGNVQKAGQVDKVVVESLADHGGAKIDQLLQAATGHEGGDAVAKLATNAASPDAGHVQAWDSAMAMGFHPAADMMFKADASMLHHDAIQPTVHG